MVYSHFSGIACLSLARKSEVLTADDRLATGGIVSSFPQATEQIKGKTSIVLMCGRLDASN